MIYILYKFGILYQIFKFSSTKKEKLLVWAAGDNGGHKALHSVANGAEVNSTYAVR